MSNFILFGFVVFCLVCVFGNTLLGKVYLARITYIVGLHYLLYQWMQCFLVLILLCYDSLYFVVLAHLCRLLNRNLYSLVNVLMWRCSVFTH